MASISRRAVDPISDPVPSSSPAFATPPVNPARPLRTAPVPAPPALKPTVLPIILPPATLRPLAFRTFTKKHNLTLTSPALAALATFIGRHCGSGWREEGLAERVLEEVARAWKKGGGQVIVDGDGPLLKSILKTLEGCMSGGRIVQVKNPSLSRDKSFKFGDNEATNGRPALLEKQDSFGISNLNVADDEDDDGSKDPRDWIKVIGGFEQPKMVYNVTKKHFDSASTLVSQINKITPISNLLGRHGSNHLLLGLLTVSPTGTLALSDLTGSIALDVTHARPIPEDGAWFSPGMIVLIDGTYEEDYGNPHSGSASSLGATGGIGGTIGGKFISFSIGHPPPEKRSLTLGTPDSNTATDPSGGVVGPAFGWTDFLGTGSERATGARMRRIENRLLNADSPSHRQTKIAIAADLNLDNPQSFTALRTLLSTYSALPIPEFPLAIVLMGNFVSSATMAGVPSQGSIEYKEHFNALASVLSDFPQLIARTTLVFVPGDNDAWPSAFSAGAAVPLPRKSVPELFTSRIKRVIQEANREVGGAGKRKEGEAIWTTNPSRLTWFGVQGEMVLFRDDVTGRLRRTAIRFKKPGADDEDEEEMDVEEHRDDSREATVASVMEQPDGNGAGETAMDVDQQSQQPNPQNGEQKLDPDTLIARTLTRTLLDQSHLSPFPPHVRPVHWDYAHVLGLYPLPTALVVADKDAPAFALKYQGCAVMNPGRIVDGRRGDRARWVEFDVRESRGTVRVEG
ncbi:DNA-directed DNA polymerase epsilon, subunit B [Botryosphaeria dothidea]